MQRGLGLLAGVLLLLAGCAHPAAQASASALASSAPGTTASTTSGHSNAHPPASPSAPASPSRMTIRGVVVDAALHPLRANVTILETNVTKATGAGGLFRFEDLRPDVYFLTARSAGFRPQTLSVTPEGSRDEVKFQLEANPTDVPFNITVHFRGALQCALEVVIISPSCDTLITSKQGLGRPDLSPLNSTDSTTISVEDQWKTVVTDVVFDGSGQPLLDGLRVTVQGTHNQSALDTYQQYGRFNDKQSFTFRVEPGGIYADDTAGPVPQNTTAFRFDVYPQSLGWHATCAVLCALGAGAGIDVQFDLYITTFYGKAAPDGFTFH